MGKRSLTERTDLVKVYLDPKNDMTGRTFGEWNVLEYAGSRQGPWFKCRCSCGFIGIVKGLELRRGSNSCGHNGTTYKHGMRRRSQDGQPAEYTVWLDMRDRCNNPNNKSHINYGGRGITVCERWDDFAVFLADMGSRPTPQHTIDRTDNNGNYEPSNCRWATRAEQARNSRGTVLVTHDGVTMCLKDWCTHLGVSYNAVVVRRIRKNESAESILFGKEVQTKP